MQYTRFERARIVGARALQIAMGAPVLIEAPSGAVDPIEIATLEFQKGALPITVARERPSDIRRLMYDPADRTRSK